MSLPYRWHPTGTQWTFERPTAGAFIALEHAVYRVVEVNDVPPDRWDDRDREALERWGQFAAHHLPYMVVIRPVGIVGDDPRDRDHDRHLRNGGCRNYPWYVYRDEHYPVCAKCQEPLPCREVETERIAVAAMHEMDRWITPGVCPACGGPITSRQKSLTWEDNVMVPGGPPVTFHVGRHACRYDAAAYEKRWAAADPNRRHRMLSCGGHVTNHNDGTYECTMLVGCPGPRAFHPSYSVCRCPDCHARGSFDCRPSPTAKLVDRAD